MSIAENCATPQHKPHLIMWAVTILWEPYLTVKSELHFKNVVYRYTVYQIYSILIKRSTVMKVVF